MICKIGFQKTEAMSSNMPEYNSVNFNDYFYYSADSPSGLRWKVNIFAGITGKSLIKSKDSVAGSLALYKDSSPKCWDVRLDYVLYKAHRIIWVMINGEIDKDLVVDHIDGDPSNNLISNLRLIEKARNHRNSSKISRNKTGVTGVHWQHMNKGKHLYAVACVTYNGVSYSARFGTHHFENAFDLAVAWREAKVKELNEQGAGFTDRHGT